jgi:hypothetical protein
MNTWIRIRIQNGDRDPALEYNVYPYEFGSAILLKTVLNVCFNFYDNFSPERLVFCFFYSLLTALKMCSICHTHPVSETTIISRAHISKFLL